ncbi:MAG: GIY-YIG nuclease family protein [Bacteroidetes bacterium]|nr:GIY-YIG nuclease family protein [Bacteroidota bacterium]
MYQVYILFSKQNNRYYIGQTADLPARLERHNSGLVPSTRPYLPWDLLLNIPKPNRSEAVILERKLKNLNSEDLKKFIEKYTPSKA